MKNLIKLIPLFTILSSTIGMAGDLSKIEIFPPYLNVGCRDFSTDSAGKFGISLNKLTAIETTSTISLAVEEQLKVCKVTTSSDGTKSLFWENINPFRGYEVQYYDFKTDSIQNREEIIDANSKSNLFEAGFYLSEKNLVVKRNLVGADSNSATGVLEINKLDLLDQNDIDELDSGVTVRKVIVLFNKLNVTAFVKNQKIETDDQLFSGRNIVLTFVKENSVYKIRNISL